MQSSSQNQSMNDLLNQLKIYEEREKAFQTHLKMKDIEIQKLEKEIKKLRGDISQLNQEENDLEDDSDMSNEDMKQENGNQIEHSFDTEIPSDFDPETQLAVYVYNSETNEYGYDISLHGFPD